MTARTVDQIFQSLITYKESIPELTGLQSLVSDEQKLLDELQSSSSTARYILYLYIVAYSNWVLEKLMEEQIKEAEEIRDSSFAGTPGWYSFKALEFQYGDNVVVDETTSYVPKYNALDESKRIVGNCAVEELAGKLLLKIKGKNTDILTNDELNSFISYVNEIKFAGTSIAVQNDAADTMKIIANVRYNGQLDKASIQNAVEVAINGYITALPFNSYFVTNDLINKVQEVKGVIDFEINSIMAKATNESVYANVVHRYRAFAGHMKIDVSFPLSTYITYEIN